ncbi:MAG: hypothetical protein DRO40_02145 [Thermoprotei archaeon]|nr:MAG: hypothetical protein DRO40_02145 [Thermoprotei archaeon]
MTEKPMLRNQLVMVLTKKPWLMPILYQVYSYGEIEYGELKQLLGVKSPLLKRALWWLIKYGLIARYDNKFRISNNYRNILEEIFLYKCIIRNRYVFKIGATFIVTIVRKARISAYTIPAQLVKELSNLEVNVGASFTAKDLINTLGIPSKLAYRVVKTHEILKQCST